MDLYIAIPAWNEPYVKIATRWTIPAVKAALAEREVTGNVIFAVRTDDEGAIDKAIGPDYEIHFFPLMGINWSGLMGAHRSAIRNTPDGDVTVLLNADVVVSREFFRVIDDVFTNPMINVMACLGVRAEINNEEPPIGAEAQQLMQWTWDHMHQITRDCIWPSRLPHVLFLPDEGGVSAHTWYLHPIALRKDQRYLPLYNTIDDRVLEAFSDDEIYYVANGELFCLELSPPVKSHAPAAKEPIGIEGLIGHGKYLMRHHVRNFGQRITVVGVPNTQTNSIVDQILEPLR